MVHQRAEGRGPAPEAPEGRRRPDAAPADPAVRGVRGGLPRATAWSTSPSCCCAAYELLARRAGAGRALPRALPPRAGRRVPGHQHDPVRLDAGCWSGSTGIPFVVGDDDQSIYRWRGARVENLQQFRARFPRRAALPARAELPLDRHILEAANALIAQQQRPHRQEALDRAAASGEPIRLYRAYNERDEAEFVVNRIRDWVARGGNRARHARSSTARTRSRACSRSTCSRRASPTASTAACGSSSAQEIKDALAYLRLIANRDDDASFERVVNLPTRGIGARTLEVLRAHARRTARRCGVAVDGVRRRARRQGRGAACRPSSR